MRARTRDGLVAGAALALGAGAAGLLLRRRRWSRAGRLAGASAAMGMAGAAAWRRARALDLRGRVVMITGGSRGLGLATAEAFAEEGAHIVICARDAAELEHAAARIRRAGVAVLAVVCDVTSRAQVDRMVERTLATFGCIDVLVNNAGIIQVTPFVNATADEFDQALETMFWGALHTTEALLPHFLARETGRIVNISSIGGVVSVPHMLPYDTAKAALAAFSDGLRAELAAYGIPVTTVVPGPIRTGSFAHARFGGRVVEEYAWFALVSTLPLLSVPARRAAREIVRATRLGKPRCIIGLSGKVLERLAALFPALTAAALSVAARSLPGPGPPDRLHSGLEVERRSRSRLLRILTGRGRAAGKRLLERNGAHEPA